MSGPQSTPPRRNRPTRNRSEDTLGPAEWSALIAWGYCLWSPVGHGAILYASLGLLTAGCLVSWFRKSTTPPLWFVAAWTLLLILVTLAALVGSLKENAGLTQQAVQWFGAVVLWGIVAASFTPRFARAALRTTLWVTVGSSVLMFLYSASRLGLPMVVPSPILTFQDAGISEEAGSTAIRWHGLSTLAAGAPLVFAAFLQGPDRFLPSRRVTGPAAILCAATALVAGRRAILLVVVLTPIIMWALRRLGRPSIDRKRHPRSNRRVPTGAMLGVLALPVIALAIARSNAGATIKSAADAAATTYLGIGDASALPLDDAVRVTQTQAMLHEWVNSPLIGQGLGATMPRFSRNDERPWLFELQYHQLLFDTGLFGFVVVLAAGLLFLGAFVRAYRATPALRGSLLVSTTAGFALLIANASNPYLQAVAHGWGIALMVGMVCVAEQVGQESSQEPEPSS